MAFLTCSFRSSALQKSTSFQAIIPENASSPLRTVYLLHGLSDDQSAWMRYTSVERYANDRGLAVIMPDAARSFYTDMVAGPRYYTHIAHELVEYTRQLFHLSDCRADTFVAGLSMGGYGALKIALRNPDCFGAGASFSGAVDIDTEFREPGSKFPDKHAIWGQAYDLSDCDENLFTLAKNLDGAAVKPRIYQECGTEDFLYESNVRFRDFMRTLHYDFHYEERPGIHDWAFWDVCLPKALDFFLQK